MKTWWASLVCIILLRIGSSCTRDHTSVDSCPGCPTTVSFKADIIPIFQASCSIGGCHDVTTHAAGINLDSANAYINVTASGTGFVTPGSANTSYLYTTLNADGVINGINGMPKDLPPLPPCQVQEIFCWINQGALDN